MNWSEARISLCLEKVYVWNSLPPTRRRVYDPVSDKVRLGPLGFPTSLRTLSMVVDLSVQSRHVRILSVGLVGSQTKSVGPCSGIQKRHDQTRVTRPVVVFSYLVPTYLSNILIGIGVASTCVAGDVHNLPLQ